MGRSNLSPIADLVIFIVIFGWEGPIAICGGVQSGNTALTIVGLFITIFFWGTFGMVHLQEVYNHLRGKKK
jgi:hypothetical protein